MNSAPPHGNEHVELPKLPQGCFRAVLEQPHGHGMGARTGTCCPCYLRAARSRWVFVQLEFGSWWTHCPGELCDT